ncbi:MAG: adenylate cyclase [Candidatus Parabeggiatoa sp. nov. 2]|nr:MAG: adenylate cyclase [Beggiatoa sp. 4572_84]RKZ60618.1 MAG: adenylate cyclase [Gammaproteobacteria bacterium]HEC85381.1 TOMM precursor leader peptide-binding protein [Thioploca sp.]
MLNQPQFKRCYHLETVEPEGVFLLSENQYSLLKGSLYQQLAPLIDGQHTVDDIVDFMREQASAAEVYYALMQMEQKGYLIENNDNLPTAVAAFYETLNVDSHEAFRRLQSTKVTVSAVGAVDIEPFIFTLESQHIQVQAEGDIEVILTDDYIQNELEAFNQKALQSQRPWMLIKPVGTKIWIGPLFQSGKTGCWACLAHRLRANRPLEMFIQKRKNISTPFPTSVSALPTTLQTSFNLAATEIAKWIIQGENKKLESGLVTLDTLSLETQNHILTRRPQCPSCGNPFQHAQAKQVVLESRRKTFTADGGHRCVSPEETLKKYEHHISPITGVVRGLISISQTEKGPTPIYIAGHNFASMFDELYFLRQNIRGRSSGKGKTDIQAKSSAFCEAIERYSGIFQGDEIRQKGSYQAMGDVAIHPNACMNFSKAQYQNRHNWDVNYSSFFKKVPEPFDKERKIEWTPVWSLTYKEFKYLPTAYCYYGYPKPQKPDCWADSNGAAAGNTKEEAILQGFMELVERDNVALWWYNRINRSGVDLDSFDEPYFQALKDYYQTLHREFWVLDITSDLNIPTFAAISRRTDKEREDITLGFGAHFDPTIAILRAVTEMNQMLPSVFHVALDGNAEYVSDDPSAINWWKTATLDNQPYLVPDNTTKMSSDYPQLWSDDLLEDVMTCVKIAEKHNMEVLVLDQTRPDIGLNVVKVFVPGMRSIWNRLGLGRLYEVPVKMGWLVEPLKENQLNPVTVFF